MSKSCHNRTAPGRWSRRITNIWQFLAASSSISFLKPLTMAPTETLREYFGHPRLVYVPIWTPPQPSSMFGARNGHSSGREGVRGILHREPLCLFRKLRVSDRCIDREHFILVGGQNGSLHLGNEVYSIIWGALRNQTSSKQTSLCSHWRSGSNPSGSPSKSPLVERI